MKFVPNVYTNFEGDDAGTGQKVAFFVATVMYPSFTLLRQMTMESKIWFGVKTRHSVDCFYRTSICEGGLGSRNSVCLSVCPSVTRVDCDKTKWLTAYIFIPHERAITLLLWYHEWLVGDAPFTLKSAFKVTHPPSKNADFDRFPLITSQP